MPKPTPPSPAFIYRIERMLLPKARKAFEKAVAKWQKDVAAGKPPDPAALGPLVKVTADGTRIAGIAAAEIASVRFGTTIRFDLINPQAVGWAKTNSARLIREVTQETKAGVRNAVGRAMRGDLSPHQLQKYIHETVGLTERMELAVYRVYENGVDAGLSTADALAESQKYAMQLRKFRSEVIARTEVLRAENAGQQLLWLQARANGLIKGMWRTWIATPDERICDICGEMDNAETPLDVPWELDGAIYHLPQDSHPQCRCSMGLVDHV